jgi:anti-sigma-K factor RskA
VIAPIRRSAWIPWSLAASFAALALYFGFRDWTLDLDLRNQAARMAELRDNSAQAQRIVDLLRSRSAQHVLLTAGKTTPEPSGRAIYLAQTGSLVFQASNLKPIPTGKAYELWVIPTAGKPIPAGLFRPDATGAASVVLPELPTGVPAKAFGVTIEDAAGSESPTLPIVLAGAPSPASGD